jgi:hypothetical protein
MLIKHHNCMMKSALIVTIHLGHHDGSMYIQRDLKQHQYWRRYEQKKDFMQNTGIVPKLHKISEAQLQATTSSISRLFQCKKSCVWLADASIIDIKLLKGPG